MKRVPSTSLFGDLHRCTPSSLSAMASRSSARSSRKKPTYISNAITCHTLKLVSSSMNISAAARATSSCTSTTRRRTRRSRRTAGRLRSAICTVPSRRSALPLNSGSVAMRCLPPRGTFSSSSLASTTLSRFHAKRRAPPSTTTSLRATVTSLTALS